MQEQIQCEYCGKKFSRDKQSGRKPKYCSTSHKQRAYNRRRISNYKSLLADVVEFIKELEHLKTKKNSRSAYGSRLYSDSELIDTKDPSSVLSQLANREDIKKELRR